MDAAEVRNSAVLTATSPVGAVSTADDESVSMERNSTISIGERRISCG